MREVVKSIEAEMIPLNFPLMLLIFSFQIAGSIAGLCGILNSALSSATS